LTNGLRRRDAVQANKNGLFMPWMSATFAKTEGNRQGLLQIAFTELWMAKGIPFAAMMYSAKRSPEIRCFFSSGAVALTGPHLVVRVEC
jgi:hypothetical protein